MCVCPPKVRLSELVNNLNSSRRLKVVPSSLHLLERAKEQAHAMVPELFRWFGWRRPIEILRQNIENRGRSEPPGVNAGARRAIRPPHGVVPTPPRGDPAASGLGHTRSATGSGVGSSARPPSPPAPVRRNARALQVPSPRPNVGDAVPAHGPVPPRGAYPG
jgi:hypothetical protein